MKYIIELDVLFSPEDKTLSLNNNPDIAVQISNQANRLLLEMVKSKNELLTRNELIQRVWEDYGFTSSNNSLNVAVSEIRKAFSSLGKTTQIISTIPKVGLQFVGEVTPVMPNDGSLFNGATNTNNYLGYSIKKWSVFSLLFLTALYSGIYIHNHFKNKLTAEHEFKELIFTQDKCGIYNLGYQSYSIEEVKKNTVQFLKNCKTQRSEIFYEKVKNANLFIGICTLNDQGEYLNCITIKK
ncbi:winged helix-turn-helix domain-containing protein [Enterobacter sichuanensis]|uniref:winged helix-turn-helix domain-containing protein n=1 Tax=Enterobacter sichuanensis TaxID=2071710 RepID=UPI003F1AF8FF